MAGKGDKPRLIDMVIYRAFWDRLFGDAKEITEDEAAAMKSYIKRKYKKVTNAED